MDRRFPSPPLQSSPRRELQLQGPRPTPLCVGKDSHKIRKPPPAPRNPVIIYTVSPKVIHADLANFMSLVQRLTGRGNVSVDDQVFSPAAKLATIQNACVEDRPDNCPIEFDLGRLEANRLLSPRNPGILSPAPASLPLVSPGLFSPSYLDPSFLSFLNDSSPVGMVAEKPSVTARGSGSFFVSPGKFLTTPLIPSPGAAIWDLFKDF